MKRIFPLLLLLPALASAGSVYKWTDKDGKVHYSDKPVVSAEKLKEPGANGAAAPKPADDTEQAKRAAECGRQKDLLTTYENAARVVERDSLGNEKEFSPEEKKKLIAMTQQKIQKFCGPQAPAPDASQTDETAPLAPPVGGDSVGR